MKRIEKIEMLIGKGFLFMLITLIAMCLFIGCFCLINCLVNIMLHNFWLTLIFVLLDFILIIKELK